MHWVSATYNLPEYEPYRKFITININWTEKCTINTLNTSECNKGKLKSLSSLKYNNAIEPLRTYHAVNTVRIIKV